MPEKLLPITAGGPRKRLEDMAFSTQALKQERQQHLGF
jgi:hypothetical protein